jgi:hypothetical protein
MRLALAFALALLAPRLALAEGKPSKTDDVRKLLTLSGVPQLGKQVVSNLVAGMRKEAPNVPERFWTDFRDGVRTEELLELIVPIYERALTAEEVKALLAFYESPAGKKFVALQPTLTQQSIAVSERWSQGLADRAITKLKSEADKNKRGK